MERDILVYKLFLDDMRHPRECMYYHMPHMPMNKVIYSETDWVIVRSYTDFVQKITELFEQKKFPWLISFDHDLSFEHYGADPDGEFVEKTGKACAEWLRDFCVKHDLDIPTHYVHSMNYGGGENIHLTMCEFNRYKQIITNSEPFIEYDPES